LYPNFNNAESNFGYINFLSNGFQHTRTNASINANGGTYLYIAFASDPSTAPVLADSFDTSLYTGNGGTQSITGLGFSPSFVWLKSRSATWGNFLQDSIRGAENFLISESSAAQGTTGPAIVDSFDTDGFTVLANGNSNEFNTTYVSWNWKANSIPAINTDGTIQSIVSANANAGFSIVKYEGNGTSGATIGHGLSAAPELIIIKNLDTVGDWVVGQTSLGFSANKFLKLNLTNSEFTNAAAWASTNPNSTTFTLGSGGLVNNNNDNHIAYCFHSVSGFNKIGSYTGNGSASGPIVTTGFQPDFVMIKSTSIAGAWMIIDSARSPSNPRQLLLQPQSAAVEQNVGNAIDFNADNFQLTDTNISRNASGETYIYMAFKENPVQYAIPSGEMGYLVAAGGGGGGFNIGAGGGAGGLRTTYGLTSGGGASAESNLTLASGTYTITVGAGGIAGTYTPSWTQGGDGSGSSITGLVSITTVGGGGGGTGISAQVPDVAPGRAGGSGGGGSRGPNKPGGAGTSNQGFAGGASNVINGDSSGGGGGATQAGQTPSGAGGADGGNGLTSAITGSNSGYAGGGGGGSYTGAPAVGLGKHGGGAGVTTGTPNAGVVNTGGGAGGGGGSGVDSARIGGIGGSGVVILRMNTSDYSGATTGSPTVTTVGTETVLTYTGSGTYVHS
jgi:hypothetical protein